MKSIEKQRKQDLITLLNSESKNPLPHYLIRKWIEFLKRRIFDCPLFLCCADEQQRIKNKLMSEYSRRSRLWQEGRLILHKKRQRKWFIEQLEKI